MKISVVIPTIGSRDLKNTLDSIVKSSIEVNEIIISLPPGCIINKDLFINYNNLKLIILKFKDKLYKELRDLKLQKMI